MFDLPEHLSSLNALEPSPSAASPMDPSVEDAVWDYLNTDALFSNFGVHPHELEKKAQQEKDEAKPRSTSSPAAVPPADLKSFIAQFASDPANFSSVPLPPPYNAAATALAGPSTMSTPAPTPASTGINTFDIMPRGGWRESSVADSSVDDKDRPSGAKKLKSLGAGQAEIEEDKRRRNTEASARFRLKKKEREHALEQRAKELEAQVAALAADKSSLENENRLLKAIVLSGGGLPGSDALKRKREE